MLYTLHEVHVSFTLLPCCDGPMDLPLLWTRTPSSTYKYREIWWRRVKKPTIYNNCIYISYSETSWLLLHNIKWHQPTETWAVLVTLTDPGMQPQSFLAEKWNTDFRCYRRSYSKKLTNSLFGAIPILIINNKQQWRGIWGNAIGYHLPGCLL